MSIHLSGGESATVAATLKKPEKITPAAPNKPSTRRTPTVMRTCLTGLLLVLMTGRLPAASGEVRLSKDISIPSCVRVFDRAARDRQCNQKYAADDAAPDRQRRCHSFKQPPRHDQPRASNTAPLIMRSLSSIAQLKRSRA